jgi:hypothetical protein
MERRERSFERSWSAIRGHGQSKRTAPHCARIVKFALMAQS